MLCKAALKIIQKLKGKYMWLGLFLVQFGAESEKKRFLKGAFHGIVLQFSEQLFSEKLLFTASPENCIRKDLC